MRLPISKLYFSLSDAPLKRYVRRIDATTRKVRKLVRESGTHSDKYKNAMQLVQTALIQRKSLSNILRTPIELRALALMFNSGLANRIELSSAVLQRISEIRAKPSSLLIEAVFSYYLKEYDQIKDVAAVEAWLTQGKEIRGELTEELIHILNGDGPRWLAEESRREKRDFDEQVRQMGLDRYRSGRFLTVAKHIYYLVELYKLQPNQEHPILDEIQKCSVYDSRYDENSLLGHQILNILIEKAPSNGICDTWQNIILTIAGDPRISPSHPNYIKWWSQLDPKLTSKVRGWLSKLDLQLFLGALEDLSNQPGNGDLKRMYPARKRFMEGLLSKQLVTGTRLFLSNNAERYLKRNFKPEHLPNYSLVDGNRSLIYMQLDGAHIIEGTHNCKLWIYDQLDASAVVFDYSKGVLSYNSLTSGLSNAMRRVGIQHRAEITHSPSTRYIWQNKAISTLKDIGVPINSKDVLMLDDYKKYKRLYGAQ